MLYPFVYSPFRFSYTLRDTSGFLRFSVSDPHRFLFCKPSADSDDSRKSSGRYPRPWPGPRRVPSRRIVLCCFSSCVHPMSSLPIFLDVLKIALRHEELLIIIPNVHELGLR